MACTDHNIAASRKEIKEVKREFGDRVRVVPGVEIDTFRGDPRRLKDCLHILGYGIDDASQTERMLRCMRQARRANVAEIAGFLNREGYQVTLGEVWAEVGNEPPMPWHIFYAICKNGKNKHLLKELGFFPVEQRESFRLLIAHLVSRDSVLTPEEAVRAIRADGGEAVGAHLADMNFSLRTASFPDFDRNLRELRDAGLSGIECVHPHHCLAEVMWLRQAAVRYGLMQTAGSDGHGERPFGVYPYAQSNKNHFIGRWALDSRALDMIRAFGV
jgi:predicted metal-dependent phosphoesterase TrpH